MTNTTGEPVHFAFPFERGSDGKVKVNLQGSPDHTFTQVQVIARYPKGLRAEHPDFGITWPEFAPTPVDAALIAREIADQVETADLTYDEYADAVDAAIRYVTLEVRQNG